MSGKTGACLASASEFTPRFFRGLYVGSVGFFGGAEQPEMCTFPIYPDLAAPSPMFSMMEGATDAFKSRCIRLRPFTVSGIL